MWELTFLVPRMRGVLTPDTGGNENCHHEIEIAFQVCLFVWFFLWVCCCYFALFCF